MTTLVFDQAVLPITGVDGAKLAGEIQAALYLNDPPAVRSVDQTFMVSSDDAMDKAAVQAVIAAHVYTPPAPKPDTSGLVTKATAILGGATLTTFSAAEVQTILALAVKAQA